MSHRVCEASTRRDAQQRRRRRRYLHQAASILHIVGSHHLETGHRAIPGSEALRVLSSYNIQHRPLAINHRRVSIHWCEEREIGRRRTDGSGSTVGATEDDGHLLLTTRHVQGLGGTVDDVVDGLRNHHAHTRSAAAANACASDLHGEVPGHELANGAKTSHGSTLHHHHS